MPRQQRRMVLNRAMRGDRDEFLRHELQHIGHHAELDVQTAQRLLRFRALQRCELEDGNTLVARQ